jgi:hypothetical protein
MLRRTETYDEGENDAYARDVHRLIPLKWSLGTGSL